MSSAPCSRPRPSCGGGDALELWLFLLSWLPGPLESLLFVPRARGACRHCGARRREGSIPA